MSQLYLSVYLVGGIVDKVSGFYVEVLELDCVLKRTSESL